MDVLVVAGYLIVAATFAQAGVGLIGALQRHLHAPWSMRSRGGDRWRKAGHEREGAMQDDGARRSVRSALLRTAAPSALVLAAMLAVSSPTRAQVERDPAEVVGPAECAECHKTNAAVWRNTHHYATFREMPRKKEATEIARKMGLRRIKEGSVCLDCHFTTTLENGAHAPIAGVSCESCHGAGKGYLKLHAEFSGKKEEQETPEEEALRWEKSEKAGLIRPQMMYGWAKNCYACHVVPQEKLVNVGGHPAGSAFELVAWSQGEVRHNVWYNKGEANPPADLTRRRLMFVVGLAVELETALRAVAKATEKAEYAVAMAKRAAIARKRFAQATQLIGGAPEMAQIVQAAEGADLKLNNEAELMAAAGRIGTLTRKIVEAYDGSTFGGIDKALPGESDWKGTPQR